jgi:hypothetical protein
MEPGGGIEAERSLLMQINKLEEPYLDGQRCRQRKRWLARRRSELRSAGELLEQLLQQRPSFGPGTCGAEQVQTELNSALTSLHRCLIQAMAIFKKALAEAKPCFRCRGASCYHRRVTFTFGQV